MQLCNRHWDEIKSNFKDNKDRELVHHLIIFRLFRKLSELMPNMDVDKVQSAIYRYSRGCVGCFYGDSLVDECIRDVKEKGIGVIENPIVIGE